MIKACFERAPSPSNDEEVRCLWVCSLRIDEHVSMPNGYCNVFCCIILFQALLVNTIFLEVSSGMCVSASFRVTSAFLTEFVIGPTSVEQQCEVKIVQNLMRNEEKRLGLSPSDCLDESHHLMIRARKTALHANRSGNYCNGKEGPCDDATRRFLPKFMNALDKIGFRIVKDTFFSM
jgi:hypothetical protein